MMFQKFDPVTVKNPLICRQKAFLLKDCFFTEINDIELFLLHTSPQFPFFKEI